MNNNFLADSDTLKLILEAVRIKSAHLFDPYLAVHSSNIEPLPHQISAVYNQMLTRTPLRYLIADDPGAGKTIMTGLYIKELILRENIKRCLIVTPGSLSEQWQDELLEKFDLHFDMLTEINILREENFCIARLDKLSRDKILHSLLKASKWDLIVIDEAHKMSASVWSKKINYTQRFRLGQLLSRITKNFLLLTATPHNGKNQDFRLFLSLIDPDRFGGVSHNDNLKISDVMRRLTKEDLRKFDGSPLFPERIASTVNYELSCMEKDLYDDVTNYVRQEFNRADKLQGKRKNNVGFALTILQRRLASSPEAIYKSLSRRLEKLQERLLSGTLESENFYPSDYDPDDFTSDEIESLEDILTVNASASTTIYELKQEINTLQNLVSKAEKVSISGQDKKWNELSRLIQENHHEKLIIFTEHKDTLFYLERKICSLLGNHESVKTIHGATPRQERRKIAESFRNNENLFILIATDAAGEGINLQCSHLMINYDLPWNPNRIEQRFGRIHRIGQDKICYLWNLVAVNTREGSVFQRLLTKIDTMRDALGGRVFDVLGKINFDGRPLRDLLIEAIRDSNNAKLIHTLNNSLTPENIKNLLDDRSLTHDSINTAEIRNNVERSETHKLQPYFVKAFFIEAFNRLGGKIFPADNKFEILFMPVPLRNENKYKFVCFDKKFADSKTHLISPGHPLLMSVIDLLLEKYKILLDQGAIFIDDNDSSREIKLLFCIKSQIQRNQQIISQKIYFTAFTHDGQALNTGIAPYLDYRAPDNNEKKFILDYIMTQKWLNDSSQAINFANNKLVPAHLERVKAPEIARINLTAKEVEQRLKEEIMFHDSHKDYNRADELEQRLSQRLAELEREKLIFPRKPVIISKSVIVPAGLLQNNSLFANDSDSRKFIELSAMNAVIKFERSLGHSPRDVSSQKLGYDIESASTDGDLLFIEVKGRSQGAQTVTISANEIRTALNRPKNFILAIVEINGDSKRVIYLARPFTNAPDFAAASVNYNIADLLRHSEILHDKIL